MFVFKRSEIEQKANKAIDTADRKISYLEREFACDAERYSEAAINRLIDSLNDIIGNLNDSIDELTEWYEEAYEKSTRVSGSFAERFTQNELSWIHKLLVSHRKEARYLFDRINDLCAKFGIEDEE